MLVHAQTRDRQGLDDRYLCDSTLNFIRAQEKEVTIALTSLSVHILKLDRAGREGRGETGDPGTVIIDARLSDVIDYANCQPGEVGCHGLGAGDENRVRDGDGCVACEGVEGGWGVRVRQSYCKIISGVIAL